MSTQPITENRFVEVVTEQEWESVRVRNMGHRDVAQAVKMLATAVRVKIKCPEGLEHKKRSSAREMAARRGMDVQTVVSGGWLYIVRQG